MIARPDWLENYSRQGFEDRSTDKSLFLYGKIDQLIGELTKSSNTLTNDAATISSSVATANADFLLIGFSKSC